MASKVSGIIEKIQTGGSSGTVHAIASTAYGVCDTAASEQYKNVDMTGFKLEEGVTIHVKFSNANSADNPKLKFNGEANENAKAIVQYGDTAAGKTSETNGWNAGAVLTLTYDGTSWVRDQGYNTNDSVSQSASTTASWRKILLSNNTYAATSTAIAGTRGAVYEAVGVSVQPSTGTLHATIFDGSGTSLTSLNASNISSGTLNTDRLPDDVVKKRTGLSASTTETDLFSLIPGMYDHTSSGVDNALPTGYGTILNITGSYYYGALIAAETNNSLYYRAYYYQNDEHEQWRGNWQMVAHTDYGTAVGNATTPIYISNTGVVTAGTAIGASAYHNDSYFATAEHGLHVPTLQTSNQTNYFLRGDNSWSNTLTNGITISKAAGTGNLTGITVENTDLSRSVGIRIGGQSGNGGLIDITNNKWIVYSDLTGNVTLNGNANTATSWANARKVYVALGTASKTTTINGGASDAAAIALGVDGTLAIGHGGTGANSANGALINLFTADTVGVATGDFTDSTIMITSNNSGSTANWYRRTGIKMWNYIKGKADSIYATQSTVNGLLAAADAMIFKGTLGTNGTITSVPDGTSGHEYQAGYTYKIITAGTYANIVCEEGDLLIAISDSASDQSSVNNEHWTVVQTNIDGAVTGPSSAGATGNIAVFDGTSGKIIKDSGTTIANATVAKAGSADLTTTANALTYYTNTTGKFGNAQYVTYLGHAAANAGANNAGYIDGLLITGTAYGEADNLISGVAGQMAYGDAGPQIRFNSNSQLGAMIFNHYDTNSGMGAAFNFVTNQGTGVAVKADGLIARTRAMIGGNSINSNYILYSNGATYINGTLEINGVITAKSSQYTDGYTGALNMNNSNIYGLNSIYTADTSDGAAEGIHFYRSATTVDSIWVNGGNIYFAPNRTITTGTTTAVNTTAANSEKVTRLPATVTSERAIYTDGTTGKLAISAVTSTELGYLSGVTSAIQTQLNGKSDTDHNHTGTYLRLDGSDTMTGALKLANNTWNTIGDDAYLGDINKAGHIGIQGKNGSTGIFFTTYNQTTKSVGGAITWNGTNFSITSTTAIDASISGNAATATSANHLNSDSTANTTGLQYYSGQPTIGSADGNAFSGSSNNYKLWSYPEDYTAHTTVANIQSLRLYWSSAYFHEIFTSPNNENLLHRSVLNSVAKDWRVILDSGNTYAAKTDDTAVSVTCGTAVTIATINGNAVKINVTKPSYTYSDVGAAPSSTVSCTTTNVKSALGTDTSTTNKWLNKKGEWSTPTAAQIGALDSSTVVNKVKTTAKSTSDDVEYKILANAAGASPTSGSDYEAIYDTNITMNPSTSTITASEFVGDIKASHIKPTLTKTYENVIATANNQNGAGFFYGKIRPNNYDAIWSVKVRITASVPGSTSYYTTSIYELCATTNTYLAYSCWNAIRSTSARPIYYNSYFRINSAGYTNGMSGWIGFSLLSSNEPTNTNYKRKIIVELLDYNNCTVEFVDTLVTPSNIPNRTTSGYYNSTNESYDNFDAYQQGLRETGDLDANDAAGYIRHFQNGSYVKPTTALGRYVLLLDKGDGEHVIPVNATQASSNSAQQVNTKSNLTTEAFNIFGPIEYYSTTTNIAANGNIDGRYHWTMRSDVDIRYSFNTGATLTAYKDVYIVAILETPTTAKLRNPGATGTNAAATATGENAGPITQTLPTTEDGFIYIKLGHAYGTASIILTTDHPIYYYKNGALHTYTDYADIAAKDIDGNTISSTYFKLTETRAATTSNIFSITNDTDSSSTATGALKVSGGVGIVKTLYVGTGVNITGKTITNNTTAASTTKLSSQLQIMNTDGGNVAIELYRGATNSTTNGKASWQISIESGKFHLRSDHKLVNENATQQSTYNNDILSINHATGNATFVGTITATTYYGQLDSTAESANASRHVWFGYYDSSLTSETVGRLAHDDDFKYNPSTNLLTIGQLTITGGTTNSSIESAGILSITGGNAVNINSSNSQDITITSAKDLILTNAASQTIVFKNGSTEAARFNTSGKFQIGTNVTQSTHSLLVNGSSAFRNQLAFVTTVANTLTEAAAIGYNSSETCFNFRLGSSGNNATTMKLSSTAFYHATTNTGSLGTSTYRWRELYMEAQNSGNLYGIAFYSGSTTYARIGSNNTTGGLGLYGSAHLWIRPSLTDMTKGFELSTTNLYPTTNDDLELGSTQKEWKNTYSKTFIVEQKVTLQWNSTDQSLDFIFA